MGWDYYGFRPYVPVAQRRRQAQRELEKMRKKGLVVLPILIDGRLIAKTFWGKAWCENLESYSDYREPPSAGPNVRTQWISRAPQTGTGSESRPSSAAPSFTRSRSRSRHCPIRIGSPSRVSVPVRSVRWSSCLQGRLSKSVMDVVTQRGGGLFPKPAEIKLKCSCPDSAYMCKHVAAVMYGVGARLDDQPELLFLLRKVDHLELIAGAVEARPTAGAGKSRGKKTIAAGDLADVFGIEMAEAEVPALAPPATAKTPAKSRASASKPVSKKKPTPATLKAKKAAGAAAANRKKAQNGRGTLRSNTAGSHETPSRKRAKQATT